MVEINIDTLRKLCKQDKIKWSMHALKRLRERHISIDDYLNCIYTGEIIEQYPNDYPKPSCLVFGYNISNLILHTVSGCDNVYVYAITAYYPNNNEWENDYKTRKEH